MRYYDPFLSTPVNEYDIKGVVIFAITLISFFDIAVINSLFYSFYSIDSLKLNGNKKTDHHNVRVGDYMVVEYRTICIR